MAKQLGAHIYIDNAKLDFSAELQKLGGANVILSTVTDAATLAAAMNGLGPNGKLIIVGVPEKPLNVETIPMLFKRLSIVGWPSGTGMDCEDTLKFSVLSGVRPMIETFPLEKAADAYDRMMSGKARFRAVITMGK
jgi:D-arabinose 1-dehydrogenase-like Zn-dependent alcohol dehydrogenase